MIRIASVVCIAALAACGGSSANPALSKTFNYSAPTAPTSSETSAGNAAQAGMSDTTAFSTAPDATRGASIVALPLEIAGAALGDATFGYAPSGAVRNSLMKAATFDACATVTATSVTFKNCTDSESGFTVTINGSITVNAGNVKWGISAGFSGSQNGETISINMSHSGDVTVSAGSIKGNAGSQFSGNVSASGQNVSFGFAVAVVMDLTYANTCQTGVTGGSVEVKRVWTAKPQGASGSVFADAGVKLIWSGCGAFQVAHST